MAKYCHFSVAHPIVLQHVNLRGGVCIISLYVWYYSKFNGEWKSLYSG